MLTELKLCPFCGAACGVNVTEVQVIGAAPQSVVNEVCPACRGSGDSASGRTACGGCDGSGVVTQQPPAPCRSAPGFRTNSRTAIGVKNGAGPTALSMVRDERDAPQIKAAEQIAEIERQTRAYEAIDEQRNRDFETISAQAALIEQCEKGLNEIAEWRSHSPEYAADYGSNGVRDLYRSIARQALSSITLHQKGNLP